MKTLYIYLDESGNFDFGPKGTKHFVLCAMTTISPIVAHTSLLTLKHSLLEQGIDIEHFHATEDKQTIRNQVFNQIKSVKELNFDFAYVDKSEVGLGLKDPTSLYLTLAKPLLEYCFLNYKTDDVNKIVVILDKALGKKSRELFRKLIKPDLKTMGIPFRIYFHFVRSDFNAQIVDYVAWSLYVKLEGNERRSPAPYSQYTTKDR